MGANAGELTGDSNWDTSSSCCVIGGVETAVRVSVSGTELKHIELEPVAAVSSGGIALGVGAGSSPDRFPRPRPRAREFRVPLGAMSTDYWTRCCQAHVTAFESLKIGMFLNHTTEIISV